MVKSKRGFSALSKTLVFITILALCLFGFSAMFAYAEDESGTETPPTETAKTLAEKLSKIDNLWKVEYAAITTDNGTQTAAAGTLDSFHSKTDYVSEGVFHVGTEENYYVYARNDTQYTVSLDTTVKVEGEKTLAEYIETNISYENETAIGVVNNITERTTTATVTLKKPATADGATTQAEPEILTLTKKWAVVTPHLSYVNNDTTEKFAPVGENADFTYGDTINVTVNTPKFDSVYGGTTINLKVEYTPSLSEPDYVDGFYDLVVASDGKITGLDSQYGNLTQAVNALISKHNAGYYIFTMGSGATEATPVTKGGITYYVTPKSTAMFQIKPYDLGEPDADTENPKKITATANKGTYNHGNPVTPGMTIKFGEETLVAGRDYTLAYENNTVANNDAKVTATGIGNFCGEIKSTLIVEKASNRIDVLTIESWDFGRFDGTKNAVRIDNVEYAPETAEYTVCRLTPNDDGNPDKPYNETEINETLTGFTLTDGKYTQEVADELKKLPVGEYVLQATIPEGDNWKECIYEGKNTSYQGGWKFEIHRAVYAAPALPADLSYEYNGSARYLTVSGYNSVAMRMSVESDKEFDINHEDGVVSAVNAGTYKITLEIADGDNCAFENNRESVELTWTITPKVVTAPKADETRFTINGKNQTYNPVGFDSSIMNIAGNVSDQSGAKVVTVSLKDKENYVWDSGDTDDITFAWYVDTADTEFAIAVSVLVCLIAVGIAIAVMQYINHRQRLLVFAEAGSQSADQSAAASEETRAQAEESSESDSDEATEETQTPDSAENKATETQTPDSKKGGDDNE